MSCYVRLMRREDIAQVTEIDREAFPTLWPPTNYRNELDNKLAYYIAACDGDKVVELSGAQATSRNIISGLTSRVKQFLNRDNSLKNEPPVPSFTQYITGFAGFWVMAGEAHVTNIAVRETHRQQGIGELLLISLIDLAAELDAGTVNLEVRVSNTPAQSLYSKYGFIKVGLRRGYYIDDKEDAALMTVENITSESYQTQMGRLKQAHSRKWRIDLYRIAR